MDADNARSADTLPDNSHNRAAMLAYVQNPTKEAGDELMMTLMKEKFQALVPMAKEPDGKLSFVTVVGGARHPILHVFTALEEMRELDEDVLLYLYPFADLVLDLLQDQPPWSGLIVDPDAEHSITEFFPPTGGHVLCSTAALRKAADQIDPGMN